MLAWRMLVAIAAMYAAFIAFASLLSQSFFGFSLPNSVVAITGFLVAIAGISLALSNRAASFALYSAIAGLAAVAIDAGEYYLGPHHVGNYYAWHLMAPFAIGLIVVGCAGWLGRRRPG